MNTLQKLNKTVHTLQEDYIPRAKARRFLTGIQALSLQPLSSLNSAGRSLHNNRSTGERRIERTVNDQGLAIRLQTLLVREVLSRQTGLVYCSLDHSQFGPFCIAVLDVSFRKGRAIPIWCQVNLSRGAQLKPMLAALEQLFVDQDHHSPEVILVLVMDRWFAGPTLFRLLDMHNVYFICRVKANRHVFELPWTDSEEKVPVGDISELEAACTYAELDIRLIRSELKEGMKEDQPWFLLTNLPVQMVTRRQVLNRYAERFEIEETFKDLKWLQRLEWQQIRKPEVIRSLLLFVFLGWWLMWSTIAKRGRKLLRTHTKKQLSWFRQAFEELQRLRQPELLQFVGWG